MGLLIAYFLLLVILVLIARTLVNNSAQRVLLGLQLLGLAVAVGASGVMVWSGQGPLVLLAAGLAVLVWHVTRQRLRGWVAEPESRETIEADYVRVVSDPARGVMEGDVRRGRYAGRRLSELDTARLIWLWRETARADPLSAQLVESYLDQLLPNWRTLAVDPHYAAPPDPEPPPEPEPEPERWFAARRPGGMGRREALRILGLDGNPSDLDVTEAHRRLILANHPDRGGSDAAAARINEARAVLLGR